MIRLTLLLRCVATLIVACGVGVVMRGQAADPWTNDLAPIPAEEWSYERAAHLMERAGFGATPEIVERYAVMSPEEAVAALLDYEVIDPSRLPRFEDSYVWDDGMDPFPPTLAEALRIARDQGEAIGVKALAGSAVRPLQPIADKYYYAVRANALELERLATWWMNRMLISPRPLEEKLTLFWHGHFATNGSRVNDARLMEQQHALLRQHANGSFGDLLSEMVRDPALLLAHDNAANVKGRPNETLGRAVLERFTVGPGRFSDRDVRDTARAFTGWTRDALEYSFNEAGHDAGEKTVLGRSGALDGDDIVDIALDHAATAEFVVGRLYRYFVRDSISATTQTMLARTYRQNGYRMKPLLRQVFVSKDFYSRASVATRVKSPVELIVSTYKKMGLTELPTIPDANALATALGQTRFNPPAEAGWPQGRDWLSLPGSRLRDDVFRDMLFPDPKSFRAPDRTLPPEEALIGERLASGMDSAQASNPPPASGREQSADRPDTDFDDRFARYRGYVLAFERAKEIPRRTAVYDVAAWLGRARITTAEAAVDYLAKRCLRVSLTAPVRQELVDGLEARLGSNTLAPGPALEPALRELLAALLGSIDHQLG